MKRYFTARQWMQNSIIGMLISELFFDGEYVPFWIGILIFSSALFLAKTITTGKIPA